MIMGSDGVLDNMFDKDMAACVKPEMNGIVFENPQGAADCIATVARKNGYDENYMSPFAVGA